MLILNNRNHLFPVTDYEVCNEVQTAKKRLICYYRVEEAFRPYDLDPCLCTHVIYSYVAIKENFAFIAGKKGKNFEGDFSKNFKGDFSKNFKGDFN